jgi:hypothetical protein
MLTHGHASNLYHFLFFYIEHCLLYFLVQAKFYPSIPLHIIEGIIQMDFSLQIKLIFLDVIYLMMIMHYIYLDKS